MTERVSEFEFCLATPIKFESKGAHETAYKLILKAPSNRNRFQRALLKQQLMIAFKWMENQKPAKQQEPVVEQKQSDSQSADDMKEIGSALSLAVYAAPDVNISVVIGEFNKLLIEGVCSVEGEKDLTQSLFDKLNPDDVDKMLGEYLANFIMPS